MTTYRTGDHHGVTICVEGDGITCARPGHDCARGHLVAVIVNGDQALAERICALLNANDYPHRCLGCGNHFRTAAAATECAADHRAHAERLKPRGDA